MALLGEGVDEGAGGNADSKDDDEASQSDLCLKRPSCGMISHKTVSRQERGGISIEAKRYR